MIIITHEHLIAYKFFFIIVVNFKCNLITLTNTVLLKVIMILKNFFINIKFIALNFI